MRFYLSSTSTTLLLLQAILSSSSYLDSLLPRWSFQAVDNTGMYVCTCCCSLSIYLEEKLSLMMIMMIPLNWSMALILFFIGIVDSFMQAAFIKNNIFYQFVYQIIITLLRSNNLPCAYYLNG